MEPNRYGCAAVAAALLLAVPGAALGQTTGVNPNVSVISQFIACPEGATDCAFEEADGDLELQELEIAFQGYLNPFVRADVFTSFHEDEFEVEEAFATFVRGLGPVQAKAGKYLVDWGSLNSLHPHTYSWIFRPLVEERLFGEEGLSQVGVNANVSFPAGRAAEAAFSVNVLRGDLAGEGHGAGEEAPAAGTFCVGPGCDDGICDPATETDCALVFYDPGVDPGGADREELAYHLRVSYFNQLDDAQSLRVGANGLIGTLDPALDREVRWYGADFKYRWRPNRYRSLNVIGAFIRNEADLERETVTGSVCIGPDCVAGTCPPAGVCREFEQTAEARGPELTTFGWYLIGDWQFAQRWNAGLKLDRAEGLEQDDAIERAEAFVNFRLMEESTLFRLLVRREDGDLLPSPETTTALQLVFSLGPHKPHAF